MMAAFTCTAMKQAAIRAATPEAMCTTVTPAKSMAPIAPKGPRKPPPQTSLAIGE